MRNTFGTLYTLTTFGESHGEGVGGVIDGMPSCVAVDEAFIQRELDRRRPGQSPLTTGRKETDKVRLLSGIFEGKTTGTPIGFVVPNTDARPEDYATYRTLYRPSHADYTYQKKYGYSPITREMLDDFAYHSQLKADKAIKDGAFKDEIVPVVIKGKKGDTVFDTDEGPRMSSMEVLGKLKPCFKKDGIVTAANSSAINDGAAALVVMSEEKAKELGVEPLATWVAGALAGVEPEVMGLGPIAATKKVMAKTGLTVDDMDLIEANEAFAAQSVAVGEALHFDQSKLNVNGGAIALGHPVGASGARIIVTLIHEMMKREDAKKGLATLCIGGGMGTAVVVEKV